MSPVFGAAWDSNYRGMGRSYDKGIPKDIYRLFLLQTVLFSEGVKIDHTSVSVRVQLPEDTSSRFSVWLAAE